MDNINILHLSDLHFGIEPDPRHAPTAIALRQNTLDALLKKLKRVDQSWRPDIVVISGDIGWKGRTDDYDQAQEWLIDNLMKELDIAPERLLISPGNHDIDRTKTIGMSPPAAAAEADEWLKVEHLDNFIRPFEAFKDFSRKMAIPQLVAGDRSFHTTGMRDLLDLKFIMLNSAWFCRGDADRDRLWPGLPLLKVMNAASQIGDPDKYDDNPITIALMHHPPAWLNEAERHTFDKRINTIRYLAERSHLILTGHVHAAFEHPDRKNNRAYLFSGGATYEGDDYRNNISILKINKADRTVTRRKFEFDPRYGSWADNEDEALSLKSPHGDIRSTRTQKDKHKPLPEIPNEYRNWVIDHCRYMEIDKLRDKTDIIQVNLPEIFIPLYCNPPGKKAAKPDTSKQLEDERASTVDIEKQSLTEPYLLVEGEAGCGKTTLIKHIAHSALQGAEGDDFSGFLPVMVFLRDLKQIISKEAGQTANASMAERILTAYFKMTENVLDIETVRAFGEKEKTILLLDGLDEIEAEQRDLIANSFADFRIKNPLMKLLLAGRPHSMRGAATKRFGQRHIKILPLGMGQVEAFITKWFQYVYAQDSKIGRKTAESMIGDVKAHPATEKLRENPLMLTAICILYHDGRELPGQRAELYKKFIDNLLARRFDNQERVLSFFLALAHQMQTRSELGIDRSDAVKILGSVYERDNTEDEKQHRQRQEALFNYIEPRSGLLKLEEGQYKFQHLTFQEFLTARFIIENETDYAGAIRNYWEHERFKEVIELYIGYLSIENRLWANTVIEDVLNQKDKRPFLCWRLAARAFIDIHEDRRNPSVVKLAVNRLREILDKHLDPKVLADAGETLGRLGDPRNLEAFATVRGGRYELSTGITEITAFEMGKYPVTNQWFRKFIEDDGYRKIYYWSKDGKKWLKEEKSKNPRYWFEHKWNGPNLPVVGVSFYESEAFCNWLTETINDGYSYSLPDGKQGEVAAAGFDKRKFPWGNRWDKRKCNTAEDGMDSTSPVGIYRKGATPEGIFDLAGNVFEWTWDAKREHLLRGGSWLGDRSYARCAYRFRFNPGLGDFYVGFRCVRTLE